MKRPEESSKLTLVHAVAARAKKLATLAPTRLGLVLPLVTMAALMSPVTPALSSDVEVKPMGNWLEYRQADYKGNPLIIHLRTGYERAVLFPEPVRLNDPDQTLPDCDLVLDEELLGFYPKRSFKRQTLKLTGSESGTEYVLVVQASPYGIRQPLQIELSEP